MECINRQWNFRCVNIDDQYQIMPIFKHVSQCGVFEVSIHGKTPAHRL